MSSTIPVSAVNWLDALRRSQQEAVTFDRDRPDLYTLTSLNDLAGIRVLAFPTSRLTEVDEALRKCFPTRDSDPVEEYGEFTYFGFFSEASEKVKGEYQMERDLSECTSATKKFLMR